MEKCIICEQPIKAHHSFVRIRISSEMLGNVASERVDVPVCFECANKFAMALRSMGGSTPLLEERRKFVENAVVMMFHDAVQAAMDHEPECTCGWKSKSWLNDHDDFCPVAQKRKLVLAEEGG